MTSATTHRTMSSCQNGRLFFGFAGAAGVAYASSAGRGTPAGSCDPPPAVVSSSSLTGWPRTRLSSLRRGRLALLRDPCGLSAQVPQVVQLRPTYVAAAGHLDLLDDRRVQRERTLHADTEAHLAHREGRSEEHTSELQSRGHLVCRLVLETNA